MQRESLAPALYLCSLCLLSLGGRVGQECNMPQVCLHVTGQGGVGFQRLSFEKA